MIETDDPLITGIYIRVSTEEQAKEGFSINAQKLKLQQYASARDWGIYDFYIDDGISGKNLKDRPNVMRMLNDVKNGNINNVLVYKIDRLTRSTKNLIELIDLFNKKHCSFNSLMESIDTSSATGRMFIKIVGIFAEFERENLAERVAFGYEQKTREGNYTNTRGVYGYDYIVGEGKLVVNEYEKQIVNDIYDWYINSMSLIKIGKMLADNKVPTKRGGKWCQGTVRSILTNPLYIGKVRYNVTPNGCDFMADGEHEKIIDEEKFYRVQEIMKQRQHFTSRRHPSENAYFLGTLLCSKCGRRMISKQHRDKATKDNNLYASYSCTYKKNGQCDAVGFSHKKLEKAFIEYIKNYSMNSLQNDELDDKKENISKEKISIEEEIKKLLKRKNEISDLFIKETISFDEYKNFSTKLDEGIKAMRTKLEEISDEKLETINVEHIKDIINNIELNWKYLTEKEKLGFINGFIRSIHAYSDNGKVIITDVEFYNV